MNKNLKGFVHISVLIILALVVVGGIGYYAYKNGQIKLNTQENISPNLTGSDDESANWKKITPQITTTAETQMPPTESYWLISKSKTFPEWNTYTHKKHSFSIDLPPNWSFDWSIIEDENRRKIGELSPGKLTIKDAVVDCNEFFERTINGGENVNALETTVSFSNGYITYEDILREEIVIDNKKWHLLRSEINVEPSERRITSWYPHQYCYESGEKLFLITFYELSLPNNNEQTINQILSTFKFTN